MKLSDIKLNDPAKFLLLFVAMIGGFVSLLVAQVMKDPTALAFGAGIIGTVVGYLTGNGVLAKNGRMPEPAVATHEQMASVLELRSRRAEDSAPPVTVADVSPSNGPVAAPPANGGAAASVRDVLGQAPPINAKNLGS